MTATAVVPRVPRSARPPRRRRSWLAQQPVAPRALAPKDGRWLTGVGVLALSALLLSFVLHVALLSGLQHYRAQTLAYDELRESLAKAETPVGQLTVDSELTAPGTPLATLKADSIGLNEVVLQGSSAEVLRSGIGHRRDSVMPGQVGTSVILGRQLTYGGPFGNLNRLSPGDEIDITTGQSESTYRVIGVRRVGDPMPAPLAAGQGRLELQTADGLALFPSGVMYVDAELVSEPVESPSRVMSYPALPTAERAMGQDTSKWFISLFLLILLAAAVAITIWLWRTWGKRQAWVVGFTIILAFGVAFSDSVMNAMPNLL